jgi:hypothetical protein
MILKSFKFSRKSASTQETGTSLRASGRREGDAPKADDQVSNRERGKSDCLMIPSSVPVFNSAWFGTGTVTVEFLSLFCMIM